MGGLANVALKLAPFAPTHIDGISISLKKLQAPRSRTDAPGEPHLCVRAKQNGKEPMLQSIPF